MLEISFYTYVPKATIIWGTVSKIEWDRQILSFLGHFLPFYPHNNPENENFEKLKIAYEDVILLYMCTKNHDYMVYASCDMGATHNFLSFWVIFCPSKTLLVPKIKNCKKIRKHFFFCLCTIIKIPEIYGSRDINFSHFGSFFALLSH